MFLPQFAPIFLTYTKHLSRVARKIAPCDRVLSEDQRVWVCLEYARIQNAAGVKRRWPGRWVNIPASAKREFLREATCHDLNKSRSGRPRTARTPENIELDASL